MGHFSDENIPFEVSLGTSEENIPNWDISDTSYKPLKRGRVTFTDAPVPAGIVIPSAHLAVLSVSDLTIRSGRLRIPFGFYTICWKNPKQSIFSAEAGARIRDISPC